MSPGSSTASAKVWSTGPADRNSSSGPTAVTRPPDTATAVASGALESMVITRRAAKTVGSSTVGGYGTNGTGATVLCCGRVSPISEMVTQP